MLQANLGNHHGLLGSLSSGSDGQGSGGQSSDGGGLQWQMEMSRGAAEVLEHAHCSD